MDSNGGKGGQGAASEQLQEKWRNAGSVKSISDQVTREKAPVKSLKVDRPSAMGNDTGG